MKQIDIDMAIEREQPAVSATEATRRQEVELGQFLKLCELMLAVEATADKGTRVVGDTWLKENDVVIGAPLVVDDDAIDFEPRFFQPYEAGGELLDSEIEYWGWVETYENERSPGQSLPFVEKCRYQLPQNKAEWFTRCAKYMLEDLYEDGQRSADACYYIGDSEGHLKKFGRFCDESWYYHMSTLHIPCTTRFPHAGATLEETTIPQEDEVLLSEVGSAAHLIKYRLRNKQFTNHHTKPVLIFTFCHESYARITLAHVSVDTGALVLRQSRLLHIQGKTITPDAILLVRWMVNTPMGETEYAGDSKEESGKGLSNVTGELLPIEAGGI